MRLLVPLLLLAATLLAGPRNPNLPYAKTPKEAVEMARTRGKLIFITVIVDNDDQNRATIKGVLHDKGWQKIARNFVLIYANKDEEHGTVMVKTKNGKRVQRDADVPELTTEQVRNFANSYVAAFYPEESEGIYRTPIHFIVDANEDAVDVIFNGDWKGGFNAVPVSTVIARMKKALRKHGKGINEKQYEQLKKNLLDAKTARARKNQQLEIKLLLPVAALPKKLADVKRAQGRLDEIDAQGRQQIAAAEAQINQFLWEDALDALEKIESTYKGLPSALRAATRKKALLKDKEVKKVLKARDLYETAMRYKKNARLERARKKFAECVRRGKGTKWAEKAAEELKAFPASD